MSLVLFGQVAVLERLRPATPTPVLKACVKSRGLSQAATVTPLLLIAAADCPHFGHRLLNYSVVLVLLRPGVARDSEVGSLLYGHCRHHAGRFSLSG